MWSSPAGASSGSCSGTRERRRAGVKRGWGKKLWVMGRSYIEYKSSAHHDHRGMTLVRTSSSRNNHQTLNSILAKLGLVMIHQSRCLPQRKTNLTALCCIYKGNSAKSFSSQFYILFYSRLAQICPGNLRLSAVSIWNFILPWNRPNTLMREIERLLDPALLPSVPCNDLSLGYQTSNSASSSLCLACGASVT